MANFVAIVDPDRTRRLAFVQLVEKNIAPVAHLSVAQVDTGDFHALWAAHSRAPVSEWIGDRAAAIQWGYALDPQSRKRLDAETLFSRWTSVAPIPFAFDGYHASIVYARDGGLIAGVDLLGLFPLYYATQDNVAIVSSTPEPFRHHPLFPASLDVGGLVGLMLTRAPIEGRTLLRGINRLSAQHALVWHPRKGAREMRQFAIPLDSPPETSTFAEDVERLGAELDAAVRRHTSSTSHHGILLSGGRDSRLFAGYLAQQRVSLDAVTLGSPRDFEVRCARPVARELGLAHTLASVDEEGFVRGAALQANQEHLVGGFGNVFMWGIHDTMLRLPPTVVVGYLADSVLAGKTLRTDSQIFDQIFPRLTQISIPSNALSSLLRGDRSLGVLEETTDRIRRAFEEASPPSPQRGWIFQLLNSERCVVGAIPWRISFGSWPVVPVLDRRVLETVGTLPASTIARRRAQDAILVRRFPRLARIPVVAANGRMIPPVKASVATRMAWRIRDGVASGASHLARGRRRERRYNYRMYDFDGPGWRAVRHEAEPLRERLSELFDLRALAAYLPPPDVPLGAAHPIFDTLGRKMIVGLMLWAREHLP